MAPMSTESLSERDFDAAADTTLRALDKALNALEHQLEVDLESGILTIEFEDGVKYVVNSHRAARQIWMAAERSAWHFDYRDGRWIATKSGDELWSSIEAVISRKLGAPVGLSR